MWYSTVGLISTPIRNTYSLNTIAYMMSVVFYRTRQRRTCAMICCGLTVIILAIMIPVGIFVIAPKIAQSSIDSSDMLLHNAAISEARNDSFILASTGEVKNAGFLDATMSFPDPVKIYWTNVPNNEPDVFLASMNLPDVSVSGEVPKSGSLEMSGVLVKIEDQEAMGKFSAFLIKGDTFSWKLVGNANAKAFGITLSGLSISKVVTLPAFKGLKNVTIDAFDLPDSELKRGIRVKTETTLDNPSTTSMELGDLEFNTSADGKSVGTLAGKNITLVPGPNKLKLEGFLNGIDPKDVDELSKVFTMFIGGSGTPLDVVGTKVTPPLGPVSWLTAGFVGTKMSVTLNPPGHGKMQLVSGIKIPSMGVSFNANDKSGYSVLASAPQINANFKSPFGFPLNIETAQQDLDFIDPESGRAFMHVKVPFVPATADQKAGTLSTSFANAPLTCIPGAEDLYSAFFKALTVGSSHTVKIDGLVTTTARTAAGLVTISNVSLTDSITLSGFQGLNQVSIGKVNVRSGDSQAIHMEIDTTITNPSTLSLNLNGDARMTLMFEGHVMGDVVMPSMSIVPGPNRITAKSSFRPQGDAAVAAGRKLLSKFLLGETNSVTIIGSSDSTPYKSLASSFDGLKINSALPGQKDKLINSVTLSNIDIGSQTADAELNLNNPLGSSFTLISMSSSVEFNGQVIGSVSPGAVKQAIVVGPNVSGFKTPKIQTSLKVGLAALEILEKIEGGGAKVNIIQTSLTVKVGEYLVTIDYSQNGVDITATN